MEYDDKNMHLSFFWSRPRSNPFKGRNHLINDAPSLSHGHFFIITRVTNTLQRYVIPFSIHVSCHSFSRWLWDQNTYMYHTLLCNDNNKFHHLLVLLLDHWRCNVGAKSKPQRIDDRSYTLLASIENYSSDTPKNFTLLNNWDQLYFINNIHTP